MKIYIYWLRKSLQGQTPDETRTKICDRLSLPTNMNVNRETEVNVCDDSILERLQKAEKQGFINIRIK